MKELKAYLNGQCIGRWHPTDLQDAFKIILEGNSKKMPVERWIYSEGAMLMARVRGNCGDYYSSNI